jgi:ABC-type transporter Mla subunit MlaD
LKISKEVRVGFIGFIVLFATLFTFNYLNRANVFSTNLIIKAKFKDLEFLKKGDPVHLRGKEYGKVVDIYKEGDILWADLDIDPAMKIPRNAKAIITEFSLLGGRMVTINYTGLCEGDCLKDGDIIPGEVVNMKSQVTAAAEPILKAFGSIADTLMGPDGMNRMIANAYASAASLAKTTKGFESKMRGMNRTLPGTIKGFKELTESLLEGKIAASDVSSTREMAMALDSLVNNLSSLSQKDIDEMTKLAYTLGDQARAMPEMIKKAEGMLANADKTLDSLNLKIAPYQKGASGMVPNLLYNGDYKDSLNSSIQNASEKLRDIRKNPQDNLSLKK